SVGVNRSQLHGARVEVLLEDLQRRRGRGRAAVSSVLDHGTDDDLRRVGRRVAAPPRLVLGLALWIAGEADDLLGRPRLAGDRNREGTEDAGGGSVRCVGRLVDAVTDD